MEMKSELKYIFANVNEWLKFAEAKHAGLIVLNAGLVVGIISSYLNIQSSIFKPCLLIGVICFGVSICLSIISLFPITNNSFFNRKDLTSPNLYFFGHLAYLNLDDFLQEIKKVDESYVEDKFDKDLINQILVNSRITKAKYTIFKIASYTSAIGFGIIGFSTLIKILWHF
jgi:hypothetical protein